MDFSAFSGPAFWAALLSIIVANILLSGDNAVVIALASRNLPAHQQKKAIFWGSAAAIILRVVLTVTVVQLLTLPYLDRKSTRLNSSHIPLSRMPSSA